MSITPPPFTYEPIAQITPFTYREGATLMSIVRLLKDWSIKLGPQVQQIIDDAVDQFSRELADAKQSWQESFDQFMENVFNELKAMNDPVISSLINDLESETREAIQDMLTIETRPLVYQMVADAIASNPTIVETANNAVEGAVERLDIITGDDPRAEKQLSPDIRWAKVFTDKLGNVSAGFTKDGTFESLTIPTLAGDFIRGIDNRTMVELSPDSPWAWAVTDQAGNVILGVKKDGGFFNTNAQSTSPARTMVVGKGDSLVRGYTNSTAWDISESWPGILNTLLEDVTVVNGGYGGRTIDDVRFLLGENSLWVDALEGDIIPATGSVQATVHRKLGAAVGRESTYYGTLQGIKGYLTYSELGQWSFTRSASGEVVPFTKPEILKRDMLYPAATSIIWAGRNDVNYNVVGNESSVLEHMKSSMTDMINQLPGTNPQFLVVSVVNQSAEISGSTRYNTIVAFNDWLKETYPGKYIDIRGWMVNEAIYGLGLEPTDDDLAAMANDAPPPSIMDGGSHYIKPVAPLLANIFKNWLQGKGYI